MKRGPFYSLNEKDGIIPYMKKNSINYKNKKLVLYTSEKRNKGKEKYCHSFFWFKDEGELRCKILDQTERNRCFFETIQTDNNRKLYFDLDARGDIDIFEVASSLVEGLRRFLLRLDIKLDYERDILIYQSKDRKNRGTDEEKKSIHIIIDNYYLQDLKSHKIFMREFTKNFIDSWEHKNIFDSSVYTSNRNFRILGCQKRDSGRIKKFVNKFEINGVDYRHNYGIKLTSKKHKFNLDFSKSLITHTKGCIYIDTSSLETEEDNDVKVYNSDNKIILNKNIGNILLQEVAKYEKRKGEKAKIRYRVKGINGSLITLERKCPGYCKKCKRIHESENPYLTIGFKENIDRYKYSLYFGCRRSEDDKTQCITTDLDCGEYIKIKKEDGTIISSDNFVSSPIDNIVLDNNDIVTSKKDEAMKKKRKKKQIKFDKLRKIVQRQNGILDLEEEVEESEEEPEEESDETEGESIDLSEIDLSGILEDESEEEPEEGPEEESEEEIVLESGSDTADIDSYIDAVPVNLSESEKVFEGLKILGFVNKTKKYYDKSKFLSSFSKDEFATFFSCIPRKTKVSKIVTHDLQDLVEFVNKKISNMHFSSYEGEDGKYTVYYYAERKKLWGIKDVIQAVGITCDILTWLLRQYINTLEKYNPKEYPHILKDLQVEHEQKIVERIIKLLDTPATIKRLINFFTSSCSSEVCVSENFDTNKHLLGVLNGVVDLKTGIVRERTKEDYISRISQLEYEPYSEELFRKFLLPICRQDEEMVTFLQLVFGYIITGDTELKKFFVFYGAKGNNGKSTLLAMLRHILGKKLSTIGCSKLFLSQNIVDRSGRATPELMICQGKRLVCSEDLPKNEAFNEKIIKTFTGDKDTFTGRALFGAQIEFENISKLVIQTNFLPESSDDVAFLKRIIVLRFLAEFVDDKEKADEVNHRYLKNKNTTKNESLMKSFFSFCVNGSIRYYKEPFVIPESIKLETDEYKEDALVTANFMNDFTEKDDESFIRVDLLFELYRIKFPTDKINSNTFGKKFPRNDYERIKKKNRVCMKSRKVKDEVLQELEEDHPNLFSKFKFG